MSTPTVYTPAEMLARLVAFDTTSRNSNLELIGFVADYLAGYDVAVSLTHDDDGRKANLFATIGPEIDGGVVLSGHTDVVPVDGQDWHTDPFTMVTRDGRHYGRGTTDMKGFIAAALAHVPQFVKSALKVPIHLAFSYDEEVGCLGVGRLIEAVKAADYRPAIAIVGEPTNMRVVNAHKGTYSFRTTVHGHEAHSSATHMGVNAVMVAARLVAFLDSLAEEMKTRARPESGFVPAYTTVHVGTIRGGTALNIIPRECRFAWEYRLMPGADPDEIITRFNAFAAELEPAMKEISGQAGITTEPRARVVGLHPEDASPAERLVMALTGDNTAGKVSYATEAGMFQEAGLSTVVCGPGDIAQAHKPDEYLAASELDACAAFMGRLANRLERPL